MINVEKIKIQEKVAYGFGDFGFSIFWKLFSAFLLFFYTDIFGISAAAAGTMFLITRIWDSVNDPLMGMIGDRTKHKLGKFRPYLLYAALPFAIVGILTFTTPDLDENGKLIYAYITYTLMMMVYTAANVPYASLLGVITSDSDDRTSLASWRFIGGYLGGLFVTGFANSFFEYFKKSNTPETAFQLSIAIFAVITAISIIITFAGTKERIIKPASKKSSFSDDIKDLINNGPWLLMLGAVVFNLMQGTIREGTVLYYFKYYIGDQAIWFWGNVDQTYLASIFLSSLMASSLLGVLLAKKISSIFGKKQTFLYSMLAIVILNIIFFFLNPSEINLILIINFLIGIPGGIISPIIWSMYADISDHSEFKTGRRATGLIFSSSSMTQKIGWTVGSAVAGWLLAIFGFEANVMQDEESLYGIKLMISLFPAICAFISAAFVYFYPLNENYMEGIKNQLDEQRLK